MVVSGTKRSSRSRMRAIAAVSALLIATFVGALSAGAVPSLAGHPTQANPASPGASQLRAASLSLSAGQGPAASHPASLPQPTGGYAWHNVTSALTPAPSGRVDSMAWDAGDGYVLLYGWLTVGGILSDTWSYANGSWTNLTSTVTGVPATGALNEYVSMGYDPMDGKVVAFFPLDNATWTYHAKMWTNVTAASGAHPPGAVVPGLVADTTDGEMLFQGGEFLYNGHFSSATWIYKNGVWSNISSTSPFNFGRIVLPVLSDDPADHGVLAFAVSSWGNVPHASTFLFSAGVWTNLTPTAGAEPPATTVPAMGYLATIGAVILYDGTATNATGSVINVQTTWMFSSRSWTNVTAATGIQPQNGEIAGGAVDPVDGTFVLFGGIRLSAPAVFPSTWLFSAAPHVSASVNHATIDLGQSVTFTGTATGTNPVTVGWGFGDSTTGSGTSASHTYTHTGVYTVTATATDFVGATGTASVSVAVNPALAVSAAAIPTTATQGVAVAIQSTVVGGSAPYTYAWNLGDHNTSTASSLGHTYGKTGSFDVTLTVTDGTGATAVTNFTVVVGSAPSTGSTGSASLTSGTGLYLLIGLVIGWVLAIAFLAMWAGGRRGRGGPPQPYTMGSSGEMGSSPPGGMPPGAGGMGPPPPPG